MKKVSVCGNNHIELHGIDVLRTSTAKSFDYAQDGWGGALAYYFDDWNQLDVEIGQFRLQTYEVDQNLTSQPSHCDKAPAF